MSTEIIILLTSVIASSVGAGVTAIFSARKSTIEDLRELVKALQADSVRLMSRLNDMALDRDRLETRLRDAELRVSKVLLDNEGLSRRVDSLIEENKRLRAKLTG